MRCVLVWLTLLVFLAAPFPAALGAEEKDTIRSIRKSSRGSPPETVNQPRPPFNDRPPKPGRPPGFKPPQWSIGLNIRPRPKPVRPWYATCPPYCIYEIYRDDDRAEETESVEEETGGREEEAGYFEEAKAPEETTYFQSGGTFERMEEEAAAPPHLQRDGYQADMDSYNLMMKAWQ